MRKTGFLILNTFLQCKFLTHILPTWNRGAGMYLKILRIRQLLSQTWSGQNSKIGVFKALSQNMVRTSPYVLICSGTPVEHKTSKWLNKMTNFYKKISLLNWSIIKLIPQWKIKESLNSSNLFIIIFPGQQSLAGS